MPSQASSDATLKVSPNLSVTLLAANLRDFLRGTDQGWLYLEVGLFALLHRLSSSEVRLLRRSIERNEDSPKDAHQRQLCDGHLLFRESPRCRSTWRKFSFIALQQSLLCTCSSRAGIGGCSVIRLEGKKSAGPCHPPFLGPDRLCCRNTEQGLGKGQKQCTKPVSRQAPKLKPLRSS